MNRLVVRGTGGGSPLTDMKARDVHPKSVILTIDILLMISILNKDHYCLTITLNTDGHGLTIIMNIGEHHMTDILNTGGHHTTDMPNTDCHQLTGILNTEGHQLTGILNTEGHQLIGILNINGHHLTEDQAEVQLIQEKKKADVLTKEGRLETEFLNVSVQHHLVEEATLLTSFL